MASTIKLVLTGDSKSLKAAIDDGSLSLSKLSTQSRDSINSFAKWGAAGTVAGAAIIAGVVNSARKSIDVLAKKSDQLGITTEKLAAFQHLGELTGVSTESMNSSLERMSKRLGEAAQGMGAAKPQLEALNLSATDLIKLSPDKQYEALADAIKGLDTQSEKAAATAALFGREGLALLNTIEAGAEGFAAAEEDVRAFGLAISRVDAAKVEEANDAFTRVQLVFKGIATHLTVELAPVMKVLADRFVDAAKESEGFTDQIVDGINLAIDAVAFFADMVKGLEVVWQLAEVAALGFISATLTGFDELQKAAAGALSWIPGVDVAPSAALSEWAEESRVAVMAASEELGKLIDEPMPSTQVKKFFTDIKAEAEAAAIEIAEAKKSIVEPVETEAAAAEVDPAIQKEIDAQAAKYLKLREMAEAFQLSEEEREVARFERENEQFNLDLERLQVEGEVTDEMIATQNQARADAEAIHQENLSNIETDAKSKTAATIAAMEKTAVAQSLALGDQLVGESAAGQAVLLAIRAGIAINETIINTQVAGIRALAELGPILGPPAVAQINAMGAASVGLIGASAVAEVAGMAHDGLDRMPSEGTMLLKRDEMVLDSGTSQAVRDAAPALAEGGGTTQGLSIENINITSNLTEQNSKSYVRDVLIPELNDAYRDGFLFGQGAFA